MNKDALKKHHFWILAGLAPLFVLIAVIMVTSEVGGAISDKQAAIEKAKKEIAGKTPKSDATIAQLDKQVDVLRVKQTDLWKENWERQIGVSAKKDAAGKVVMEGDKVVLTQDPDKNLLRWPTRSPMLKRFNYTADYATDPNQFKFGDRIPDEQGEYDEFKKPEVYLAEFANVDKAGMADLVAPTTFAGGWWNVLRYVRADGWGVQKPKYDQLWLALEDLWVQRALLGAVRTVNNEIGRFAPVPRTDAAGAKIPDAPLERSFQSRVWRIDLKVVQQAAGGKYVITGVLTNLTDQLQLLGGQTGMTLNVWLSDGPNAQPVPFRISGEFVPGRGAKKEVKRADGQVESVDANVYPVVQTEEHILPLGSTVEKIARVEQVFDTKTVPVRQINRVALGKCDSRHAPLQTTLKLPGLETGFPYLKKLDTDLAAAAAPAAGGAGGAAAAPAATPDGGGKGPLGVAFQPQYEGGGDVGPVIDGNRKRYIEVTPQVRRMPVAIVLVVDQAYIQDVLLAYANNPLRFQITQFHWQRFRGTLGTGAVGPNGQQLPPSTPGSPGIPLDEQPQLTAGGVAGGGFGFGPAAGGALGGFPRPGVGAAGMEYDPTRPFGRFGAQTTIAEGQQTAGLVELSVYGIVSLYEKYSDAPPAAADAAGGTGGAAAPMGTPPAPAPMPK